VSSLKYGQTCAYSAYNLNVVTTCDFLFAIELSSDFFYMVHISTKIKRMILKFSVIFVALACSGDHSVLRMGIASQKTSKTCF